MTKRWIIPAIALVGLALLAWWIASNTYWAEIDVRMPLRGEAVSNPFYAAQRFTEALGAQAEKRQALGTPPSTDSVLVLSYWHWSLIASRRKQLEQWVQAGGRLVLDRTLIGGEEELKHWSGLELAYLPDTNEEEDEEEEEESDASSSDEKNLFGQRVCCQTHFRCGADSLH